MIEISICFNLLPSRRSSRPEMFCKKGVLRNLTKFTRKHWCHSLFFNKVAGLRRLNAAIYFMHLAFNRLMFLTYQASDFNN